VIVGKEGVELARKVDELDDDSRKMAKEIAKKKEWLDGQVPKGINSLEDFMDLAHPDGDLDARLAELQAELDALLQYRAINEHGYLKRIILPTFPNGFFELLARQLAHVAKNAEQAIRTHMEVCGMDQRGEAWIEQGLEYTQGSLCPFCEQNLTGSALFESYKGFFDASYRNLKGEIDKLRNAVEQTFGEQALLRLQGDINENRELCVFWERFVPPLNLSELPFNDLVQVWRKLRIAAQQHLVRKRACPLEPVVGDIDLTNTLTEWRKVEVKARLFNDDVNKSNKGPIARKKDEARGRRPEDVEGEILQLEASRLRYKPEVDQACLDYVAALDNKKKLGHKKDEAKADLDNYAKAILPKYQGRINALLKRFNAGFSIEMNTSMRGGTPSSSYEIVINNIRVDLGGSKTLPGTPCFKNTLSSGDRSTLALAFFLARLQHDAQLAEKIVVFDDPNTSQDASRSAHTQQLICYLYDKIKQVVVLSHDPRFLRNISEEAKATDVSALKISPTAEDNSALEQWEIERAT
jgi:wobble nucleotide-excising tRNase